MNRSDRCFVDTNIFIYSVGRDHPYREPCARIVTAAAGGTLYAVTSTEVIQEIAHRFTGVGERQGGVAVAREAIASMRVILPVHRSSVADMLELIGKHPQLSARDALHIAVARQAGIETIVTADRHFQDIPGMVVLHPVDLAAQLPADIS